MASWSDSPSTRMEATLRGNSNSGSNSNISRLYSLVDSGGGGGTWEQAQARSNDAISKMHERTQLMEIMRFEKEMANDPMSWAKDLFGQLSSGGMGGVTNQYTNPYEARLNSLLDNPDAIQQTAGYKFRVGQGQEALNRNLAAKGMLGSGNRLMELTKYGQDMASQEYDNQAKRLSDLVGNRNSYNASLYGSDSSAGASRYGSTLSALASMMNPSLQAAAGSKSYNGSTGSGGYYLAGNTNPLQGVYNPLGGSFQL